jgi:hypothetical protein
VDSATVVRVPDADVGILRDFLRQYDVFASASDVAMRSDPALAQVAKGAMDFLDQIAQVRQFMSPLLEGDRALPRYTLLVRHGEENREVQWQYGDSLHVATAVDSLGNERRTYAKGGWAPLRYLMSQRDTTLSVKFFHPETKIEKVLPVFPVIAPEIVLPRSR